MDCCIKCPKQAMFGFPHDIKIIFCDEHKPSHGVFLIDDIKKGKHCAKKDCLKLPTTILINRLMKTTTYFCCSHKKKYSVPFVNPFFTEKYKHKKMIKQKKIIKRKLCEFNECKLVARYNFHFETVAIFCYKHKKCEMINVVDTKCTYIGCFNLPYYNHPNSKKPHFCSMHKLDNMVNVYYKLCLSCVKYAQYNYADNNKPIYCIDHKYDNMINVVSKYKKNYFCTFDNCTKTKIFNFPHIKSPLFCFEHSQFGMINVRVKRCEFKFCIDIAVFGFQHLNKPVFCSKHKENDMICVFERSCLINDCVYEPTFNFPNQHFGLFCKIHAKHGMINVFKKCKFEFCCNARLFGFTNKKLRFCFDHKKDGMISDFCCSKCFRKFDVVIDNVKFCLQCEPDNLTEIIIKKKCKYCDIQPNSNHVCFDCLQRKCRTEFMVIQFIKNNITTPFVFNSNSMLNGCSKKRPDLFFDLPLHCVIVEIDETQHLSYNDNCECARINEIANAIGGKSIVIIRFNPDNDVLHSGSPIDFDVAFRLHTLVDVVKREILHNYTQLNAKLVLLFFNNDSVPFQIEQTQDITSTIFI